MLLGIDTEKDMDKILGLECSTLLLEEVSEIKFEQYQLLISRLRENKCKQNRIIMCCNPSLKKFWVHQMFVEHKNPLDGNELKDFTAYVEKLNPEDNLDHLSSTYIDNLKQLVGRSKLRFYNGDWMDEVEGSLFKYDFIQNNRKSIKEYERIIIGCDPAVTSKNTSDDTGIVVCAKQDNDYYVLCDESFKGSPGEVVDKIISLWHKYSAKTYIEQNQGGDWLTAAVSKANPECPIEGIHHSIGKLGRAEPISFLYERNLVHHTEIFTDLESQMCAFTGNDKDKSPDRMDALVIALTQLSRTKELDTNFGDAYEKAISMNAGMYIEKD
jgi:predicted phage terminase large subunit-like protein